MLVLSRRPGERIQIGDGVVITLISIQGKTARIGIEAAREITVRRQELVERKKSDEEYETAHVRHPR